MPSLLLLAALVCPSGTTSGVGYPDDRIEQVRHLLEGNARYRGFSGAVAVSVAGEVVHRAAFGLADRSWGVPNEVRTRFSIASVTKPFTAALVLELVEEGLLELDTAVSELLPDYRPDTGARITVHHLLYHGSGLPNYARKAFWQGAPSRLDFAPADFVREYCSGDLLFEPGTSALYSDANYVLLARIVERVTGRSFAEALRARVLEPLGAADSGCLGPEEIVERLAHGYFRTGQRHSLPPPIRYEAVQLGAGNMYSTVDDLLRFSAALDRPGLLDEESLAAMFEGHGPSGFEGQLSGYGWNLGELVLRGSGRRLRIQHAPGNNAGYAALLYRAPDEGWAVAVIQNTGPAFLDMRVYTLCEEILHALAGESARIPPDGLRDRLALAARSGAPERLDALYEAHCADENADRDVPGLNRLGYELLAEGRIEAAVAVFRLNLRSDPEGSNAHDSLAEALWASGDVEGATRHFQRSLELDPGNENARLNLARIAAGEQRGG